YSVLAERVRRVIDRVSATDRVAPPPARPRLAVLCNFAEEGWLSMDLVAEMLLRELNAGYSNEFEPVPVCPSYRRRATRLPGRERWGLAINADRLLNRLWDYPRFLSRRAREFDLFHLCDHSYAQLLHSLPPGRTGVFCHDLDTFRCLLEPEREPR